jgi:hypothetical protein
MPFFASWVDRRLQQLAKTTAHSLLSFHICARVRAFSRVLSPPLIVSASVLTICCGRSNDGQGNYAYHRLSKQDQFYFCICFFRPVVNLVNVYPFPTPNKWLLSSTPTNSANLSWHKTVVAENFKLFRNGATWWFIKRWEKLHPWAAFP